MSNQPKQVRDPQTQIPCPVCGGERRCPICGGTKTVLCDTCHGSGKVDCPVCTRGTVSKTCWVNCEHCHGRGILIRDGSRGTCGWCDGRGQVEEHYDEICPNCHGDYEEHKKCRSCGGRGKKACVYCKATGKVTCPLCHDEGVVSIEAICNTVIAMTGSDEVNAQDGKWVENLVVPCLTESAEHGSGRAMYALGCLYDYWDCDEYCDEEVFPCDKEIAASWYHKAAEKGSVDAQRSYAGMLERGEGGEQNLGKAFEWYEKAAQQGDGYSLLKVVYSYIDGHLSQGDEFNGTIDYRKALEGVRKIIKEWKSTGDCWERDEIEYATKYAELLPDIINGDGKAVSKLINWIRNNDRSPLRCKRFTTYWEKVKGAEEEKELAEKRAEERAAEEKAWAKRLSRSRLRGTIEGLLLLGVTSGIVLQATGNVVTDTYIAAGCSVFAVLLYLIRFGTFRLCEKRFKWRWSFVVYVIFMVLAFLCLRGYLKIPDGLTALDFQRMLAGGSILALVLIIYQVWPGPLRVGIECLMPLCAAVLMIHRANELTTDGCIVTGCTVVAVIFYFFFYRRSWVLMERLGYIAYVLFMLLLAGWPSVRNDMVSQEWLNVLDSTHSHVWGSLAALALIAYQANWTERLNAINMIRIVFGICVVSLFYEGHWVIGSFWILIGLSVVIDSSMYKGKECDMVRILPFLLVGAAITGVVGHCFFSMLALVGICFFARKFEF